MKKACFFKILKLGRVAGATLALAAFYPLNCRALEPVVMSGGAYAITRAEVTCGGALSDEAGGYQLNGALGTIENVLIAHTGDSNPTVKSGLMNINDYPRTITNLSASTSSANSITIDFTAPAADHNKYSIDASSYVVKVSNAGSNILTQSQFDLANPFTQSWAPNIKGTQETRVIDTGLQPNRVYAVAVEANDGDGNQAYLSTTSIRTMANAPSGMAVNGNVWLTSATVQWNTNNTLGDPLTYQHCWEPEGDLLCSSYTATAGFSGTSVSSTVVDLVTGMTYRFSVRIKNDSDVWTVWDSTRAQVGVPAPGLGSPVFTNLGPTQVQVNITTTSSPGTYYEIYRSAPADSQGSDFTVFEATASIGKGTFKLFEGLSVNTTYFFKARSYMDVGDTPSNITKLGGIATTVNPVTEQASDPVLFQSSATFSWTLPANPSGPDMTYLVEVDNDSGFTSVDVSSVVIGGQSTAAVDNLIPNTTYYARVTARNRVLTLATPCPFKKNNNPAFATNPVVPDAPATSSVWFSSFTFSWNENPGDSNPAATRYGVELAATENGPFISSQTVNGPTKNAKFTGLISNATYYARVRALGHNSNISDFTTDISTVTQPKAPGSLGYSNVELSSMTFSWINNGNQTGTRYNYILRTGGFSGTVVHNDTGAVTSVLYNTGITSNTTYYFTVDTVPEGGWQEAAELLVSTICVTKTGAPGAATGSPFTDVSVTSMTVNWGYGGNGTDTRYLVELTSASAGNYALYKSSHDTNANELSYTWQNLQSNTSYYFRVAAYNHSGSTSAWYSPGVPAVTFAADPVNISNTPSASDKIVVSWSGATNAPDTEYYVEEVGSPTVKSDWKKNVTNWTFAGLGVNTPHQFQVKAQNRLHTRETNFFATAGSTYTFASRPDRPGFFVLSNKAVKITINPGTNPISAPNNTKFAIMNSRTGIDTTEPNYFLSLQEGTTNRYSFGTTDINDASVWRTYQEWDDNGVVIATGLQPSKTYDFVVLARNENGVATAQSLAGSATTGSGKPVISLRGHSLGDWVNTGVIGFEAGGSFHYHYRFYSGIPNPSPTPVNSDPGWSGSIDTITVGIPLHDANGDYDYRGALKGFNTTSEGRWTLVVQGDDPDDLNGAHFADAANRASFEVFVDLTLPVVTLSGQFAANDPTAIVSGQGIPEKTPYFTWAEPANGTPGAISPILGYTWTYSSNNAIEPATSTVDASWQTTRAVSISTPQAAGTHYLKVRALDMAGNWTEPPASFEYIYQPDSKAPSATLNMGTRVFLPRGSRGLVGLAVNPAATLEISFDEAMNATYMTKPGAIALTMVRDNMGEETNVDIPVAVSYDSASMKALIKPVDPLPIAPSCQCFRYPAHTAD